MQTSTPSLQLLGRAWSQKHLATSWRRGDVEAEKNALQISNVRPERTMIALEMLLRVRVGVGDQISGCEDEWSMLSFQQHEIAYERYSNPPKR